MSAGAAILGAVSAAAQAQGAGTPSDQAIAVRVPAELCSVEERYLADLYLKISGRSDYRALYAHMLRDCPELALGLPVPTASLSTTPGNSPDDKTSRIPEPPSPGKPGGKKPTVEKPTVEKPAVEKPAVEKPAVEKPAGEAPGGEAPRGGSAVQ